MRVFDNGSLFSVTVTSTEVYAFARHWPCFGSDDAVTFQFEKDSGDLVDILPEGREDKSDGTGLVALSKDAQAYGEAQMRQRAIAQLRKQAVVTVHANSVEVSAVLAGLLRRNVFIGYKKMEALREFCCLWADKVSL